MSSRRAISDYVLAETWKFDRVLGRGADGTVYRAVDLRDQRPVAIKVYDSLIDRDVSEIEARIEAEAELLRRVRSPHMVELVDSGVARARGGRRTAYLVMELLEGDTLRGWLAGRIASGARRAPLDVFLELLRAVQYMHVHRLAHLDLKPENVFLLERATPVGARVKLLDLGASRPEGPIDPDEAPRATPAYASPEQCLRTGAVGPFSDVYSLGILLHEFLTGELPLHGQTAEEFVEQHAYGRLRALPREADPQGVGPIVRKATALEPWRRYSDAGAFHTALAERLRASSASRAR